LSRANLNIDAGSIGRAVGLSATEAADALMQLEREGLVDASRARLTMKGLVVAVSSGGGKAGPWLDLEAARRPRPARSLPMAAQGDRVEADGEDTTGRSKDILM
jgi:hypothetical protein